MLHFQRPEPLSGNLLEHLLYESIGAHRGGGVFAWATRYGADALVANEIFSEFVGISEFRLTVGTDTVTDTGAVMRLCDLQAKHPYLQVSAFLNPGTALFHPKLSWFEHTSHLSLIVGSGNLTMGGLLGNWEAFTVSHLTGSEAKSALDSIKTFLDDRSADMAPITAASVLERVAGNTGNERSSLKPAVPTANVLTSTNEVLVAEIPKSSTRWSQANFDVENYERFFGAKVGSPQRRIVLRHVDADGLIGDVENRPSVEVQSDNYRFELAAAKGRDYPQTGRPIGVFLRQKSGYFFIRCCYPENRATEKSTGS